MRIEAGAPRIADSIQPPPTRGRTRLDGRRRNPFSAHTMEGLTKVRSAQVLEYGGGKTYRLQAGAEASCAEAAEVPCMIGSTEYRVGNVLDLSASENPPTQNSVERRDASRYMAEQQQLTMAASHVDVEMSWKMENGRRNAPQERKSGAAAARRSHLSGGMTTPPANGTACYF